MHAVRPLSALRATERAVDLLSIGQAREDAEGGADVYNAETFGADAAQPGWSFEAVFFIPDWPVDAKTHDWNLVPWPSRDRPTEKALGRGSRRRLRRLRVFKSMIFVVSRWAGTPDSGGNRISTPRVR